ncbi:MAG: NF038143 family protein [Desulfobacterales bacterium]|nr:NF038143 family protein [Desulfobacterales bacterium]
MIPTAAEKRMDKSLDKKYSLVLEREKQFVKRVVYIMRAHTQPPWWHMLIPFRFLFEHMARKRDVRAFSATHLYLKQIALSAARWDVEPGDPAASGRQMQARLRDYWLHMQTVKSGEIYEYLSEWMELLRSHYHRLLKASGKNYQTLLQNAYPSSEYRDFLSRLTDLERKIDRSLLLVQGKTDTISAFIQNKQNAFAKVRERELRETHKNIDQ